MSEQLSFRQAVEADVPFLLLLRERTMVTHQLASGLVPSEDEREQRVRARFESAQIILLAGKPIGMLKVIRDGAMWDLLQIQLTPEKQGGGWGTRIVKGLIADARRSGASLRLSVLRASPARHLYERLGFVVTQEGPHSYEMHCEFPIEG
jgi:GNAT superfamily N-acetyltransferase